MIVAPLRRAEIGGPIVWATSRSFNLGHPTKSFPTPEGLWILPEPWKTPGRPEIDRHAVAGVSHRSLDGLRPPTGSTGPTAALSHQKPDKIPGEANAQMEGGSRASVATLR